MLLKTAKLQSMSVCETQHFEFIFKITYKKSNIFPEKSKMKITDRNLENKKEREERRNLVRLKEVEETKCKSCFMSGEHRTEKENAA